MRHQRRVTNAADYFRACDDLAVFLFFFVFSGGNFSCGGWTRSRREDGQGEPPHLPKHGAKAERALESERGRERERRKGSTSSESIMNHYYSQAGQAAQGTGHQQQQGLKVGGLHQHTNQAAAQQQQQQQQQQQYMMQQYAAYQHAQATQAQAHYTNQERINNVTMTIEVSESESDRRRDETRENTPIIRDRGGRIWPNRTEPNHFC